MDETERIIKGFTERLKRTKEYRLYKAKRDKAQEDPALWEEISEYRRQYYKLQKSEDELFDRLDDFNKEYEKLQDNPVVEEYLKAELAVCRMMQEIYTQIAEAVDLDISLEI